MRPRSFPYKLVTFDVNGTLLKPAEAIGTVYSKFAERHGFVADPKTVESSFRAQYKTMSKTHENFGAGSGLDWRSWWTRVVVETLRNSVDPPKERPEKLRLVAEELINFFSTGASWKCQEGAVDILKKLKSYDLQLGIISNTDPRLRSILEQNDLTRYFSFVLISYEANFLKPQTEIFNLAAELYSNQKGQTLKSEEAVHIGNSPEVDLLGAKRAGWQGVLLSDKIGTNCEQALVFSNLEELSKYFVELTKSKT